MSTGVITGLDQRQEWLLPIFWDQYKKFNAYPVVFVDFGMSQQGIEWCQKQGIYQKLHTSLDYKKPRDETLIEAFEKRYGKSIWEVRPSWFKKPYAMKQSPFEKSLWLDLDCLVHQALSPIFDLLHLGSEFALARNREPYVDFLLPGEIDYNGGVIAFNSPGRVIDQWIRLIEEEPNAFPGDQEFLSRVIHRDKPPFIELPPIYNWYHGWPKSDEVVIEHYCGGNGKIKLLNQFYKEYLVKN